ncbi:MAG: hypothetical protein FWG30_05020 [Eubacteriaceae bacterium]|nr:hypothetical protein [Eubacteriaceae bacterium]
MASESNPEIEKAAVRLEQLSIFESARMLYEAQEKERRDTRAAIREASEKGKAESKAVGLMGIESNPEIQKPGVRLEQLSIFESARMLYEAQEKERRDIRAAIREASEKGLAEGRAAGLAEGLAKSRAEGLAKGLAEGEKKLLSVAQKLLSIGVPIEDIVDATGLSKSEIESSGQELQSSI